MKRHLFGIIAFMLLAIFLVATDITYNLNWWLKGLASLVVVALWVDAYRTALAEDNYKTQVRSLERDKVNLIEREEERQNLRYARAVRESNNLFAVGLVHMLQEAQAASGHLTSPRPNHDELAAFAYQSLMSCTGQLDVQLSPEKFLRVTTQSGLIINGIHPLVMLDCINKVLHETLSSAEPDIPILPLLRVDRASIDQLKHGSPASKISTSKCRSWLVNELVLSNMVEDRDSACEVVVPGDGFKRVSFVYMDRLWCILVTDLGMKHL